VRPRTTIAASLVALAATAVGAGGDGRAAPSAPAGRPPVILLIFDEFPLDTLLRPDGRIDSERYPGFAELAGASTWFPNAHTIYDSTFKAVPAILDAKLPRRGTAADFRSHPRSIYGLFDGLGYDVVDVESGEALCPPRICPGARTRRPGVLARLAGGGRPSRLHAWIGAIRTRATPTLYVQHALLPHEPWIYLPSGRQSRPKGRDPIGGINRPIGFHDPELTRHNEGRHLLQVGFVDHEISLLMDRLRRTGLLRRALVVVTADHGYAFELGVKDRRLVTESNVDEVAPVPLFVKAPGETGGRVDPGLVRNIDVLPTIADLLEVEVDWAHDGRSAFASSTRARRTVALPTRDFSRTIRIGIGELLERREANRVRRARAFGTGAESQLVLGDPWASLYRAGSHPELFGRRLGTLRLTPPGRSTAAVANAGLVRRVRADGEVFPTRVEGTIAGGAAGSLRDVAAAVNGRVWATGRSFRLRGRRAEYFSMLVPEDALREGRNRLEVLAVGAGGELTPLWRSR
jgi:hypothetical protein